MFVNINGIDVEILNFSESNYYRNLLHNYPLLCALNCCYINGFEDS